MKTADVNIEQWDVEQIYPNPWNPNMTSARVDEAIRESIGIYGMVDPITCRKHPEIEGALQIIDGEHRLEACKELGFPQIPVVVLEINDANAKKLTIISNETRGRAERVSLSQLVNEIADELDDENLRLGLPYYEDELEDLRKLSNMEWGDYDSDKPAGDNPKEDGSQIIVKHPQEGFETLEKSLKEWLADKYPEAKVEIKQ